MELLKHQKDAVNKVLQCYNSGKNIVVYTSGVGTGKTSVFCGVAKQISGKILYIIPKKAIISNVINNRMFIQENLKDRVDFVTFNYFSDVTKGNKLNEYSLIIIDEAHHIGSELYGKNLINCLRERKIKTLGLTATPERMDSLHIGELFDVVVSGLTNFEAISQGLMPRIEYLVCSPEERLTIGSSIIDWDDSYGILKDAIKENPKDKWICFFSRIDDLLLMKPYIHMLFSDYEIFEIHSNSGNVQQVLDKANRTEKCVMLNCDMLLEGLHFDNVDGIILFREVHSMPVFEQIIGRVSALFKENNPLVIDCTDTWLRMDRYIDYIDYDLDYSDSDFDNKNRYLDKYPKDGKNIPNDKITTPCYVSLKNRKYYDYMEFLKKKYNKVNAKKVKYKGMEYPSQASACRELNINLDTFRYYKRANPNKSFEEIIDIIYENRYVTFRGERYDNWKDVCIHYDINVNTARAYRNGNNLNWNETIEHFLSNAIKKKSHKKWTEEEINIIRTYYPTEGYRVSKRLKGRTELQCKDYARRINVKVLDEYINPKRNPKKWTKSEKEIMIKYYPKEGSKVAVRLDGRTAEQCRTYARRNNIKYMR